jgi:hypothetical protein
MDKKLCPACSLCRSCLGALAPNPSKQTVSCWESFWHGKISPSALSHAVAGADKETHRMRSNSRLQNSVFHVQCVLFPQQTRSSVAWIGRVMSKSQKISRSLLYLSYVIRQTRIFHSLRPSLEARCAARSAQNLCYATDCNPTVLATTVA